MTELKRPCALQLRHNNSEGFVYAYEADEMNKYLSEVDKVIAEKDTEIGVLKERIVHHKYKRCLAMARWCESKVYHIRRTPLCDMSEHEYWQYENDFWQRWQLRWLELAEKVKDKEAK